ncbi:DUF4123 domain-containing protein [Vibrio cholerae]|nr:DUF4123 domain-containing protein [Vibrio cholerae]
MHMEMITVLPDTAIAPNKTLYLLVDGAQVEHIAKQLYSLSGELNLEPIYLYEPYNQLIEVSPYLVQATDPVKQWFFDLNNTRVGYFFSSSLPLDDVAERIRSLIKVLSPYGTSVFLKMANSECAYVLLQTRVARLWQVMEQAWLPTKSGWELLSKPDSIPTISEGMYKLSDEQWQMMGQISWRNALENIADHMCKWFPETISQYADVEGWLNQQAQNAYQMGFNSERDLLLFFNVIGFLGIKAIASPIYPDIYQLIHQTSQQTPSQRIEQAALLAEQYSHQYIQEQRS